MFLLPTVCITGKLKSNKNAFQWEAYRPLITVWGVSMTETPQTETPWTETPRQRPPGQRPPDRDTPTETPPWTETPQDGDPSGTETETSPCEQNHRHV